MCASYRILECAKNEYFSFYYIDISVLWCYYKFSNVQISLHK